MMAGGVLGGMERALRKITSPLGMKMVNVLFSLRDLIVLMIGLIISTTLQEITPIVRTFGMEV